MTRTSLSAPQQQLLNLFAGLNLPVLAAPMFLVSGPGLVAACCQAGIVGSLPAPNARTVEQLQEWLEQISRERELAQQRGEPPTTASTLSLSWCAVISRPSCPQPWVAPSASLKPYTLMAAW